MQCSTKDLLLVTEQKLGALLAIITEASSNMYKREIVCEYGLDYH
jgi:hypothetical protein